MPIAELASVCLMRKVSKIPHFMCIMLWYCTVLVSHVELDMGFVMLSQRVPPWISLFLPFVFLCLLRCLQDTIFYYFFYPLVFFVVEKRDYYFSIVLSFLLIQDGYTFYFSLLLNFLPNKW